MDDDRRGETEIRSDLPAYLNGELDAVAEARVRAALDRSPSLRQELREISEAMSHLEEAGAPAVRAPSKTGGHRVHGGRLLVSLGVVACIAAIALAVVTIRFGGDVRDAADQFLALDPVGRASGSGTAEMRAAGGNILVDLEFDSLPDRGESSYYEAWLLSPSEAPPISLGIVPHTGGTLTIPPGVPAEYTIIDVSIEHLDGDPGHSGISVLRSDPA